MSTYKRRVVYLSDIEWETLHGLAHERRTTISAVIRHAVRKTDEARPAAEREAVRRPTGQTAARPTTIARTAQAERDAILRKVNRSI